MTKFGTAIGGLLLIGALAAPVAFAHYDTGAHPVPYATTGLDIFGADDNSCGQVAVPLPPPYNGYIGPNCGPGGIIGDDAERADGGPESVFAPNKDRVSGWYYGSIHTYTELVVSTISNPGDPSICPDGMSPVDEVCILATSDIDPSFRFAQWNSLYDAEVGGLGDCGATNAPNEERIDGSTTGGGLVPDGVWNDGGHNAVGHTFGHYDCASFETAGCDRYDQAWAEDLVSGEDVWIGAQCNWGTPVDGGTTPGLVAILGEFLLDVINCPFGGYPQSCIDATQYLDDCIGLVLIQPNDTNCGGSATTAVVCGAGNGFGGIGSSIDFGRGGGSDGRASDAAVYPNASTDDDGVNCDSVSVAICFPFTAVIASFIFSVLTVDQLSVATYGWCA